MNEAERIRLCVRAAMSAGSPLTMWNRLRGETYEELEKDAQGLMVALCEQNRLPSPFDPSVNLAGMTPAGIRAHCAQPAKSTTVKNF